VRQLTKRERSQIGICAAPTEGFLQLEARLLDPVKQAFVEENTRWKSDKLSAWFGPQNARLTILVLMRLDGVAGRPVRRLSRIDVQQTAMEPLSAAGVIFARQALGEGSCASEQRLAGWTKCAARLMTRRPMRRAGLLAAW
jgi:hypothetical protein